MFNHFRYRIWNNFKHCIDILNYVNYRCNKEFQNILVFVVTTQLLVAVYISVYFKLTSITFGVKDGYFFSYPGALPNKTLCIRMDCWYTSLSENVIRFNLANSNIIPHLHNLFVFQCDVTRSLNRYEAWSKLFIDQRRTTLYRLLV